MRVEIKIMVLLLVISMAAAQSPQSFLFAVSDPSMVDTSRPGEYQPVIPIATGMTGAAPLNNGQIGVLMTGTDLTIDNITSFAPSYSNANKPIVEYARDSDAIMSSMESSSGRHLEAQLEKEKIKLSGASEPHDPNAIQNTPSYQRILSGERETDGEEKKAAPDNTLDFFSGSALSRHKSTEERKSLIEQALQAIFNQKLEQLYTGPQLMDFDDTEADEVMEIEGADYMVVDVINFTKDIRLIHQLLHPPERLHPWLKWLLYLGRVTPQMLEIYYGALQKRDQIFKLALESAVNGDKKYKIRYRGKLMNEFPVYVMPEDAQGFYELVMAPERSGNTMPAQSSPSQP